MGSSESETSEPLDVLDDSGQPTGEVMARGLVHEQGKWHRSFHLWVVNAEGMVLFQRRAEHKQFEAGRIDVSAAGHFTAGENLKAVLREVDEELGFLPEQQELHHLVSRRNERFYGDLTDREFQDVFVLYRDAPLDSYRLNCQETSVLYEVPLQAAIDLHRSGTPVAVAGWDCQARVNNALLHEADVIQRARTETSEALEQIQVWWNDTGPTRR